LVAGYGVVDGGCAADIVVRSVYPALGATSGATVVTVAGLAFTASTKCKFGTSITAAFTVDSSTKLRCTTPAHVAATVYAEVSSNLQQYTTDRVEFRYYGASEWGACRV
jgi:hypothetical protein